MMHEHHIIRDNLHKQELKHQGRILQQLDLDLHNGLEGEDQEWGNVLTLEVHQRGGDV
jgi:hypothetical protein